MLSSELKSPWYYFLFVLLLLKRFVIYTQTKVSILSIGQHMFILIVLSLVSVFLKYRNPKSICSSLYVLAYQIYRRILKTYSQYRMTNIIEEVFNALLCFLNLNLSTRFWWHNKFENIYFGITATSMLVYSDFQSHDVFKSLLHVDFMQVYVL